MTHFDMIKRLNLKPCPFCGKEVEPCTISQNKYGVTRLEIECCMYFDIRSDYSMTTKAGIEYKLGLDAVEKWNRRAKE